MRSNRYANLFHDLRRAIPGVLCALLLLGAASSAQATHRDRDRDHDRERDRHERPERRDRPRDRDDRFADFGPYIGGSFSIGVEQFDNTVPGDDFDQGFGFDIWAGSRITPHVGIEGQLSYLRGFEIEGTGIDFNHLNGTANLKLYPLTGAVQPWVLAGAGIGRFEREEPDGYSLNDTGGVIRVGTGVDVYLNENISLVGGVGYLFTAGDIVDTDVLEMKFGLQYRF